MNEFFDWKSIDFTRQIIIDDKHRYCAYCGKHLLKLNYIEGDDYTNPHYFCKCYCEDAKKELDIKYEISRLEREMPEGKYKSEMTVLTYSHD